MLRPSAKINELLLGVLNGTLAGPPRPNSCKSEQSVFNYLFFGHFRCVGKTFNCYDPFFMRVVEDFAKGEEALAAFRAADAVARRWHRGLKANMSENKVFHESITSEDGMRSCRTFTCATMRDLDGKRSRCLSEDLREGDGGFDINVALRHHNPSSSPAAADHAVERHETAPLERLLSLWINF